MLFILSNSYFNFYFTLKTKQSHKTNFHTLACSLPTQTITYNINTTTNITNNRISKAKTYLQHVFIITHFSLKMGAQKHEAYLIAFLSNVIFHIKQPKITFFQPHLLSLTLPLNMYGYLYTNTTRKPTYFILHWLEEVINNSQHYDIHTYLPHVLFIRLHAALTLLLLFFFLIFVRNRYKYS